MTLKTYTIISNGVLVFFAFLTIASLVQNIRFFNSELKIAFPDYPPVQFETIDRSQIDRIARTINMTEGRSIITPENPPMELIKSAAPPGGPAEVITPTGTR
jgi:hypothetical protein